MSKISVNLDHRTKRRLKLKAFRRRPRFPRKHAIRGHADEKPPQPTILRATTARCLRYLEDHGLADFSSSNLVVAQSENKFGNLRGVPSYGL